jgi:hypothetical protein
MGPSGTQGLQGPVGPAGPAGPPGVGGAGTAYYTSSLDGPPYGRGVLLLGGDWWNMERVARLTLPPGSYLITATATLWNNEAVQLTGPGCIITPGGNINGVAQTASPVTLGPYGIPGVLPQFPVHLTAVLDGAQNGGAGWDVRFLCGGWSQWNPDTPNRVYAAFPHLAAIPIGGVVVQ